MIDARRQPDGRWHVFTKGGRDDSGLDALDYAVKMAEYGAGELLVTSMDRDGTKSGFDLELTRAITCSGEYSGDCFGWCGYGTASG